MDDKQLVDLAKAVKALKDAVPAILEMAELQAKITRTRYLKFVEAGFTESQALELCSKHITI